MKSYVSEVLRSFDIRSNPANPANPGSDSSTVPAGRQVELFLNEKDQYLVGRSEQSEVRHVLYYHLDS